jgi:hypothetical protein
MKSRSSQCHDPPLNLQKTLGCKCHDPTLEFDRSCSVHEEFAAEEKLNNAEVEKEEENEFLCEKKKKNYSFRKSAIYMQHLLLLFLTFLRVHEYIYIYTYPN